LSELGIKINYEYVSHVLSYACFLNKQVLLYHHYLNIVGI